MTRRYKQPKKHGVSGVKDATPPYKATLQLSVNKLQGIQERICQCAEAAGGGNALARKTGINRRTLGTYLAGAAEPKWGALNVITKEAHANGHWLLTGEGPMLLADSQKVRIEPLDRDMLQTAIKVVEEWLLEHQLALRPDKKALLIMLLYEETREHEGKLDTERVRGLLRLVS